MSENTPLTEFRRVNAFGEAWHMQIFPTHAVITAGYRRTVTRLMPGELDGGLIIGDRFGFYTRNGAKVFASGGAEWTDVDNAYDAFKRAASDYFSHLDD